MRDFFIRIRMYSGTRPCPRGRSGADTGRKARRGTRCHKPNAKLCIRAWLREAAPACRRACRVGTRLSLSNEADLRHRLGHRCRLGWRFDPAIFQPHSVSRKVVCNRSFSSYPAYILHSPSRRDGKALASAGDVRRQCSAPGCGDVSLVARSKRYVRREHLQERAVIRRLLVVAVLLLMTSCGRQPPPPPKSHVSAAHPIVRRVVDWDDYVGRFQAVQDVTVTPRVSGTITQVLFRNGQDVKAGQALLVIDPRPFQCGLSSGRGQSRQGTGRSSQCRHAARRRDAADQGECARPGRVRDACRCLAIGDRRYPGATGGGRVRTSLIWSSRQ